MTVLIICLSLCIFAFSYGKHGHARSGDKLILRRFLPCFARAGALVRAEAENRLDTGIKPDDNGHRRE